MPRLGPGFSINDYIKALWSVGSLSINDAIRNFAEAGGAIVPTGATTGHPTTGTWYQGQLFADSAGNVWLCTVTGTPGTWVEVSSGGGFVNPMTTAGDLIYGGVAGAATRLGIGSSAQILTVSSGNPIWATFNGMVNPMTTAGDLIQGGTSGTPARIALGSNTQVLTIVSGAIVWATPASGFANPMTTIGDIIVGGTAGAPARLGIGTATQWLGGGTTPAWSTPTASQVGALPSTSTINAIVAANATSASWTNNGHSITGVSTLNSVGQTGAAVASRYAGATAGGAPATGTFNTGDYIIDVTGSFWVCTSGGSPGTWAQVGGGAVTITHGETALTTTVAVGTGATVIVTTPSLATGVYFVTFTCVMSFVAASGSKSCDAWIAAGSATITGNPPAATVLQGVVDTATGYETLVGCGIITVTVAGTVTLSAQASAVSIYTANNTGAATGIANISNVSWMKIG